MNIQKKSNKNANIEKKRILLKTLWIKAKQIPNSHPFFFAEIFSIFIAITAVRGSDRSMAA